MAPRSAAAAVCAVAAVSSAGTVAAAVAPSSAARPVACSAAMILYPAATPGPTDRVIFGRVFVAGRDQVAAPNPTPSGQKPFLYYAKMGIAVVRGTAATVTLAKSWRSRVAIEWGNSGPASRVHFSACRVGTKWAAYAGGFHFRSKVGGCVPLRISVARRSETLRFSAGRRC